MKQRVAIAMSMAQSPRLLLADEPTSALDVTVQAQVIQELKKIRENFNYSYYFSYSQYGSSFIYI